ncbi:MAG TPA: hypothetical protein VGJ17_07940 [Candidatus Limnocylindrales bacterium]|jgi:hypothetical protein
MSAPTPRLEPFRPTPQQRKLPDALRDPVRIVLLVAGLGVFVGSAMSWAAYFLPGHGLQEISSFERAGDGAITLVLGIILVGITWADRIAESKLPGLVLLPLVLGVVSISLVKFGWDQDQSFLAGLANAGGYGYMLPGFWATLAAAGLAVLAGAVHVIRMRDQVSYSLRVSSETMTTAISGLVGAVIGIGAAVVIGEDFSSNPTITGSAVTFLSIILGLVGAWLGAKIGKSFVGGSFDDGAR